MRTPREISVFLYRATGTGYEVLTLHRSQELGGYWHVVAGALEAGETSEDAALRELREETGLDAKGRLMTLPYRYTFPVEADLPARRRLYGPDVETISGECFAVETSAGWEPRLNHEHDRCRWCQVDEALRLLHWPETREALLVLTHALESAG